MQLFQKSPDKQLAAARADVDKLVAKLADAEQQVIAKRIACEGLALEPDVEQRKAEAAYRAAQDHVNITLAPALKTKRELVAALQAEVADIEDKALRAETNQAVVQLADDGPAICADLVIDAKRLSEWAGRSSLIIHDTKGIEIAVAGFAVEVQTAVDFAAGILRSHAAAVLSGGAPASLPRPAPPPAPIPLPPPTMHVTALKPVAWLADGVVQKAAAGVDLDLPIKTGQHAIKIGACCEMTDPRRKAIKITGSFRVGVPLRRNCIDLDPDMPPDTEPEPLRDPVLRSVPPGTIDPSFHVIPPSQLPAPRVMSVARNDTDLIARNNKDKT